METTMGEGFLRRIRQFLPKSRGDKVAFAFLVVCIHLIFYFEQFRVLPEIYHEPCLASYLHTAFMVFVYINTVGNLFMMMNVDTTTGSHVLPSVLKPGWHFCASCEANSPPRSFHCWECGTCVLKRIHHCTFTGNCAAWANERYYMVFLLYMSVGAVYTNVMNFDYVWDVMGGLNMKSFLTMLAPLVMWLAGAAKAHTFFVSLMSMICLIGGAFSLILFYFHTKLTLMNRTVFEFNKRIGDYDLGCRQNLEQAFGTRWPWVWLFPLLPSPLPGNGLEFPVSSDVSEAVKDM
ncbi:Zinc finger, DHHC-type containing 24 [Branchiostoma belcheri]|nr:Zinc finger, DHHC-type containing 24 [Branchiostoma belcheri]